jgi:hypothetical protein
LEFFFGYECLALVEKANRHQEGYLMAMNQMKKYFELLSEGDQSWCKATLEKVETIL